MIRITLPAIIGDTLSAHALEVRKGQSRITIGKEQASAQELGSDLSLTFVILLR